MKNVYSNYTYYLDFIICIFLCCYLIIDTITGYLLLTGGVGISVAYKLFLLLLILLSVSSKNLNLFILLLFLFFLVFVSTITFLTIIQGKYYESFNFIIKIITNMIYFIYFYTIFKSYIDPENIRYNVFFIISLIVFLCNIILGIFGFGFYTYPSLQVGIKGFFYAGNEASALFYCLYYTVLVKIKGNSNKILIVYIIAIIVSLLITTKTGIISCLLISAIDYYFRSSKKRKFYIKLYFPIILLIVIALAIYFLPKTTIYKVMENRIKYLLERQYSLMDAIFAGRILFLKNAFKIWEFNLSPVVLLFGTGVIYTKYVEIDLFDLFFSFGLIFTIIILSFYFYIIYLSTRIKNYRLVFFNLLYLSISLTAGHIWSSVMTGLYFAYINAFELNLPQKYNFVLKSK